MATSKEPLIFQHQPLPDSKTHIRLLKIVSVVKTRAIPVHCELTTFLVAEAPPYRAISYTWGDETPLASILVNGHQMEVRLNCEYALRQTCQHPGDGTGDSIIWIDSICVNQLDNDEKGAQVAMMGEVFKTATQVLACVGAHGDDSDFLYGFLRGEEARFQAVLTSPASSSWETSISHELRLSRRKLAAWRWKHPRKVLIRLLKALANFLARPYFHRVWIYQELFRGRDINVYCGDKTSPISRIWLLSSTIESWMLGTTDYWLFLSKFHPGMWNAVFSKIQEAMPLLLAGAQQQPLMRFSRTATTVASLSCQDPRDSIYGVLSIIIPAESHQFQPDYTKDRMDLILEVLQKTEPENFGDLSDFETLASYAKMVGLNLNLRDQPSRKLAAAKELRRSSTNLQEMVPNVMGTKDGMNSTNCWPFLGVRIIFKQDKWGFENQDKRFQRHSLTFVPPRMEKQLHSGKIPNISADTHLPPEAQDGDWLLVPRSYHWMSQKRFPWNAVAFLARNHDSGRFEIAGKILISRSKLVSRWVKILKERASIFSVYLDLEDLLVLFDLCKWDNLWSLKKWEDSESFDAYFQTRFCGRRFSSYAVRKET